MAAQPADPPFCLDRPDSLSPLFTVQGASKNVAGKLNIPDYLKFRDHFEKERPDSEHPLPSKPGVLQEEHDQKLTDGLRSWSDAKGSGWIANHPVTKMAFWASRSRWGSWRLAFVVARLQRDVWAKQVSEATSSDTATSPSRAESTPSEPLAAASTGSSPPSADSQAPTVPSKKEPVPSPSSDKMQVSDDPHEEAASSESPVKKAKTETAAADADKPVDQQDPRRCPGGCGFYVTWHKTHCCVLCKTSGKHGPRCDKRTSIEADTTPQKVPKKRGRPPRVVPTHVPGGNSSSSTAAPPAPGQVVPGGSSKAKVSGTESAATASPASMAAETTSGHPGKSTGHGKQHHPSPSQTSTMQQSSTSIPASSSGSSGGVRTGSSDQGKPPSASSSGPARPHYTSAQKAALNAKWNRAKKPKLLSREEVAAMDRWELAAAIRANRWHEIKMPKWEGDRWKDCLEQLASQAVAKEEVADQFLRKQQRQQQAVHKEKVQQAQSSRASAHPPPPTKPPIWKPVKGCTCGCPVHREKCRLYGKRSFVSSSMPSFASGQAKAKAKSSASAPPRLNAGDSIAPSKNLSPWAKGQVNDIFRQVQARPRGEWKSLLKQSMLRFHPDKKMSPDNPFASRKDEEVSEVFVDVKRFYDNIQPG